MLCLCFFRGRVAKLYYRWPWWVTEKLYKKTRHNLHFVCTPIPNGNRTVCQKSSRARPHGVAIKYAHQRFMRCAWVHSILIRTVSFLLVSTFKLGELARLTKRMRPFQLFQHCNSLRKYLNWVTQKTDLLRSSWSSRSPRWATVLAPHGATHSIHNMWHRLLLVFLGRNAFQLFTISKKDWPQCCKWRIKKDVNIKFARKVKKKKEKERNRNGRRSKQAKGPHYWSKKTAWVNLFDNLSRGLQSGRYYCQRKNQCCNQKG